MKEGKGGGVKTKKKRYVLQERSLKLNRKQVIHQNYALIQCLNSLSNFFDQNNQQNWKILPTNNENFHIYFHQQKT